MAIATRLIGDLPGRARSTRSQAYNDLLADHDVVYVVKVPSAVTLPSEGAALTFWEPTGGCEEWQSPFEVGCKRGNKSVVSVNTNPSRPTPGVSQQNMLDVETVFSCVFHARLPPTPPRNLRFAGPPPIRRATSYSQGHLLFTRPLPICMATSHSQGYLLFARPPPIRKATSHSQSYLLFARPPPIHMAAYPIHRAISHSVQFKKTLMIPQGAILLA